MKHKCFVPNCKVTSDTAPDKVFLFVPRKRERRRRWFEAVGRPYAEGIHMFCCEDHFDLEQDAKNWMHYKMIGSHLCLKENVVPHKFDLSGSAMKKESQMSSSTKKMKRMILEKLRAEKVSKESVEEDPQPSTSNLPAIHETLIDFEEKCTGAYTPSGHSIITGNNPEWRP